MWAQGLREGCMSLSPQLTRQESGCYEAGSVSGDGVVGLVLPLGTHSFLWRVRGLMGPTRDGWVLVRWGVAIPWGGWSRGRVTAWEECREPGMPERFRVQGIAPYAQGTAPWGFAILM